METLKASALLKQAKIIIENNKKKQKEYGGLFNIFSVLKMERSEVRTHSALLYEFLNNKGTHSQGDTYLKIFINDILKIKNFDFTNVKVDRERDIKKFGRIDLAIENQEHLIIIEIKIDAVEQKRQLERYNEYAKQTEKNIVYII